MGGGVKDFGELPKAKNESLLKAEKEAKQESERQAKEQIQAAERKQANEQKQLWDRINKSTEEANNLREQLERQQIQAQQMQAQWAQGIEEAHKLREELQRQQTETQNIQAQWTQGIQEVNNLKEELKTHQKEAQKIQTQLMQGIQPQFYATMQDIEDAKKKMQYDPENLHLAIAGHAGTGKSSLVNAFRRISDIHPQAAKTGVIETTLSVGRYPDPDPELPFKRFIWYDIPGSGTASISDWQYFKTQGLFVFDVLILIVSGRFLDSDIELLKNCARYNVPTFLVWSKADIPINDLIAKERANNQQMEEEDLDMFNFAGPAPPTEQEYTTAKNKFCDQARMNIKDQLHQKGLPDQRVYVVTRKGIQAVAKQCHKITRTFHTLPGIRLSNMADAVDKFVDATRKLDVTAVAKKFQNMDIVSYLRSLFGSAILMDEKDLLMDILITTYQRRYPTDHSIEELKHLFEEGRCQQEPEAENVGGGADGSQWELL